MNFSQRSHQLFRMCPAGVILGMTLSLAGCGASPDQVATAESAPAEPALRAEATPATSGAAPASRVSVDLHVMSKCPFAIEVEDSLWPIFEHIGEHVELRLHYIGRLSEDGFYSLHGPEEVYGDALQLCAHLEGDQQQWMHFIQCQNRNWREIPEGWEACAAEAGLDPASMLNCVEGEAGAQLLVQSFGYSLENQIAGSPTIFIDGQPYRGGRSTQSLSRQICARLQAGPLPLCENIPPAVEMDVTIVSDRRCLENDCDPSRFVSFLSATFEGARIRELDYSDPKGQTLFEKAGAQFLPIAIFSPEVLQEPEGFERLEERMEVFGDQEGYYYPLGRDWNPAAEICTDGLDNTGNGQIDCEDADCRHKRVCRLEQKGHLELFVMSQCPYGVRAVDAMLPVLEHFGRDRQKIDFEISFIGDERNGRFTSLHGRAEVKENIRQLCAQKHYGKNYKFMEYVVCRNADYRSDDWQACARNGIKPVVIDKCATGAEGRQLLRASFKKAKALSISGSPTWLLNNQLEMHGRNPADIKDAFCEANDTLSDCRRNIESSEGVESPADGSCAH